MLVLILGLCYLMFKVSVEGNFPSCQSKVRTVMRCIFG